jgi:hypothetical protein
MTLGDLPRAEAFKYFEHVLSSMYPEAQRDLFPSEADFDKVYDITGGRMMYIEEYIESVFMSGSHPTGNLLRITGCHVDRI